MTLQVSPLKHLSNDWERPKAVSHIHFIRQMTLIIDDSQVCGSLMSDIGCWLGSQYFPNVVLWVSKIQAASGLAAYIFIMCLDTLWRYRWPVLWHLISSGLPIFLLKFLINYVNLLIMFEISEQKKRWIIYRKTELNLTQFIFVKQFVAFSYFLFICICVCLFSSFWELLTGLSMYVVCT